MRKDNIRRAVLTAAVALLLTGATYASALAQLAYPTKPVRIIVPSAPAGVLDNVARTLALRLGDQLGQSIVIEGKGGGRRLHPVHRLQRTARRQPGAVRQAELRPGR